MSKHKVFHVQDESLKLKELALVLCGSKTEVTQRENCDPLKMPSLHLERRQRIIVIFPGEKQYRTVNVYRQPSSERRAIQFRVGTPNPKNGRRNYNRNPLLTLVNTVIVDAAKKKKLEDSQAATFVESWKMTLAIGSYDKTYTKHEPELQRGIRLINTGADRCVAEKEIIEDGRSILYFPNAGRSKRGINMKDGRELKRLRMAAGMSQIQLAIAISRSQGYVSRTELGERCPEKEFAIMEEAIKRFAEVEAEVQRSTISIRSKYSLSAEAQ